MFTLKKNRVSRKNECLEKNIKIWKKISKLKFYKELKNLIIMRFY
jgi:hypothetical protein